MTFLIRYETPCRHFLWHPFFLSDILIQARELSHISKHKSFVYCTEKLCIKLFWVQQQTLYHLFARPIYQTRRNFFQQPIVSRYFDISPQVIDNSEIQLVVQNTTSLFSGLIHKLTVSFPSSFLCQSKFIKWWNHSSPPLVSFYVFHKVVKWIYSLVIHKMSI